MKAGKWADAEAALPPVGSSKDPRFDLLRGRIKSDIGDTASAITIFEAIWKRFPGYAPARLFQGMALWDTGQTTAAGIAFDDVLQLQRHNDLARSYKALTLVANGESEAAAAIWKAYGFSDNRMFRVRTVEFVEMSWLQTGAYMGNVTCSEPIERTRLSDRKALSRFYKRDFQGMLKHLPPAPTEKELAAFLAATGHEMLKEYDEARKYLESLEPSRADWPDQVVALEARLLTREGRLADAAQAFAKILILGPEDFGTNYYLGVICLGYGKKAEARQYFLRALTNYMVDTREFQWWQIEQTLSS